MDYVPSVVRNNRNDLSFVSWTCPVIVFCPYYYPRFVSANFIAHYFGPQTRAECDQVAICSKMLWPVSGGLGPSMQPHSKMEYISIFWRKDSYKGFIYGAHRYYGEAGWNSDRELR